VAVGFDSIILLIFSQMMHAITFGMFHVAGIAATNEYFSGAYRSRGQALYSSVGFGAGGALGTFASGLLWERFDGPTTFVFSAGVAFVGAGLIYWLRRHDGIDARSS
jgi:PPP family 3-phenylpropionic acid transporter